MSKLEINTELNKQKTNTNNNNIGDEDQDTKDESHHIQEQEISDKKIIELIPDEPNLNNIKKRLFILSPTVELGFERECNIYDFNIKGKNPIGKGGYGEVWKVIHENSNKEYCIKILNKKEIFEEKLINQINKEISIMYNINHPYSIKLVNHFEDNEKLYLIMELASNGNLYTLIETSNRGKSLDFTLLKKLIIQTIEIIKYLHSKNIIYRDIKPENLLLDKDNNIKLCDYGWATYFTPGNILTTYCGTPEYVSPEMLNKRPYNQKVDIWAIGVLIFELVFGYAPFSSNYNEERFNNIKNCKIKWPKDINDNKKYKEVKNLIEKILRINPNERLSLQEIEEHEWLKDTYIKMKNNKQTNEGFELDSISQTEIYKSLIMNNSVNKEFNSEKRTRKSSIYFELEKDGSLSDKEILNLFKVENKQFKLRILKVEEENKKLKKKYSDYTELCDLNEKLNKKSEENNKQIYLLKLKLEQKDEIIKEYENKINKLNEENIKLKEIKNKYSILENELVNIKNLFNKNKINLDIKKEINEGNININNIFNEFKIEFDKLSIFTETRDKIIQNIIKKEFDNQNMKIKNIFTESSFQTNNKIIESQNIKMAELFGYRTRAENFESLNCLLKNEQKILKDQVRVYKNLYEDRMKIYKFQKEKLEELKLENNIYKERLKKVKKYVQRHFSVQIQTQIVKLLEEKL